MKKILVVNIKQLIQAEYNPPAFRRGHELANLPCMDDAWLSSSDGLITGFGDMKNIPANLLTESDEVVDASGCMVLPAFCDPHTHLVYAGSREKEFVMKIMGLSYEEIASQGGGILNSAALLHETCEDDLYRQSLPRIQEIMHQGTGAVEIKSGYGLNTEDELKMLRVIQRLKNDFPLLIRATLLGAHAVPIRFKGKQDEYVNVIINEMIPRVAYEGLADFIDVFCDKGFFTPENTERILTAGMKYGMKPKIHANELGFTGGVQVGVKYEALSVDHLEYTGDAEIELLSHSETMPTLLPGTSFFLGIGYAPARKMIDAGLPVALASDFNPGSSPSGNMKFILSLACTRLKMLPAEAINAATLNAAYAMGIEDMAGTITPGKLANFFITRPIPSVDFIPYAFGSDIIREVFINGERI